MEQDKTDKAITGMLQAAYGIDPNKPKEPFRDKIKRWSKMSLLDIGKEMYGTIHTPDMRKERDAYIKGLRHGMAIQGHNEHEKKS